MQTNKTLTPISTSYAPATSWMRAYMSFLRSSDENLVLKMAPLALLGVLPLDILSNLIPVVGEIDDVGYIVILAIVVMRTANRVRNYR